MGAKTKAQSKGIKKIKQQSFVVDCSKPVEDKIMEIAAFEKFLTDKIKVNGKTGVLGDLVKVSKDKTRVTVTRDSHVQAVPEVPHEKVPEEAQRAGLAASHRIQQGQGGVRAQVLQHCRQRG